MSNDPTTGIDPKGSEGAKKAPLHLLPSFPIHEAAWVLKLGADKYGEFNWRHNRVKASTYRSAMHRHLDQWFDGLEDVDSESGRSHLAHVISSAVIVLDAMKQGTLADDRPPRGVVPEESVSPRDAWMARALGGALSAREAYEKLSALSSEMMEENRAKLREAMGFRPPYTEAQLAPAPDPFAGLPPLPEPPKGMKWERIPEEECGLDKPHTDALWTRPNDRTSKRLWYPNDHANATSITYGGQVVYIRPVPAC